MIRSVLGLWASPFRRAGTPTAGIRPWEHVWKRLCSSEPSQSLSHGAPWPTSSPLQAVLRSARQAGPRPRVPTSGCRPRIGQTQRRAFHFSAWRRSASGSKAEEKLSLRDRLKKLSREYGWSAVGVYLALSVLDFPFCFLLVRVVGTDKIGKIEQRVVSSVSSVVPESVREKLHEYWRSIKGVETQTLGDDYISETVEMAGWGLEEAQERNQEEASLATQLALAYAIHKSFIFLRVPLTAAVTPRIVKVLRSWGWNIGKRVPK
ncbi:hypothetical protein RJ55_03262 [Drechmeria coniospora]|nr:hypothetical protein RJ55_03262 [Drechmeria coniospora]